MSSFCMEMSGGKIWFKDENSSQVHRINGPAVEWVNGTKAWYLNHKKINVQNQEEFESSYEYKEYFRLENLRAFE